MEQVGGRETLGYDIAGFHQLQSELERVRVVQATANTNGVLHKAVAFSAALYFTLCFERRCRIVRKVLQVFPTQGRSQSVRQQVQAGKLTSVGLGGGDAFLFPSSNQKGMVR